MSCGSRTQHFVKKDPWEGECEIEDAHSKKGVVLGPGAVISELYSLIIKS